MPKIKHPRCTYTEGGRRCPYPGEGSPALCSPHRIALATAARPRPPSEVLASTLVDLLQGKAINREATIGAVQDLAEQWTGMAGGYRPEVFDGESEASAHRRAQSGTPRWWPGAGAAAAGGQRPPAPPPIDPEIEKRRIARQVLGFAQSEPLTEAMIKDRRRALNKKHHPDRTGGSPERVAIINDAADVLLAAL